MNGEQNQIGPQISPQMSSIGPIVPQPRGSNSAIKAVVIAAVLLVVIAGGVLALRVWDPMWNPLRPKPDEVIVKSLTEIGKVKSSATEVSLSYGITTGDPSSVEDMTANLKLNISQDNSAANNPKAKGNFEVKISSKIGFGITLGGELRQKGKESYYKITDISLPAEIEQSFSEMGIDVNTARESLKANWIKGEAQTAEDMAKSEQILEKYNQILKESRPWIVKKQMQDEKIRAVKAYHYSIVLEKEKLKKLVLDLIKASEESQGQAEENPAFSEMMLVGTIGGIFDVFGDVPGDIWIGKKDNLPYKIVLEKQIDSKDFSGTAGGILKLKLEINGADFNKPVSVEAPADAKRIEEVLPFNIEDLLGSLLFGGLDVPAGSDDTITVE